MKPIETVTVVTDERTRGDLPVVIEETPPEPKPESDINITQELTEMYNNIDDPTAGNPGFVGNDLMLAIHDCFAHFETHILAEGEHNMKKKVVTIGDVVLIGANLISNAMLAHLSNAIMEDGEGLAEIVRVNTSTQMGAMGAFNNVDNSIQLSMVDIFKKACRLAIEQPENGLSIAAMVHLDMQWVFLHELYHSRCTPENDKTKDEDEANKYADMMTYEIIRSKGFTDPAPITEEPFLATHLIDFKAKVINPAAAKGEEWAVFQKKCLEQGILFKDFSTGREYTSLLPFHKLCPKPGYENILEAHGEPAEIIHTEPATMATTSMPQQAPLTMAVNTTLTENDGDYYSEESVWMDSGEDEAEAEVEVMASLLAGTMGMVGEPAPVTTTPPATTAPTTGWSNMIPQGWNLPMGGATGTENVLLEGFTLSGKAAEAIKNPEAKAIFTVYCRLVKNLFTNCGWNNAGRFNNPVGVMLPVFVGDIPNLPNIGFQYGPVGNQKFAKLSDTNGQIFGRGYLNDSMPGYRILIGPNGEVDRRIMPQNPDKGTQHARLAMAGRRIVHVLDGKVQGNEAWVAKFVDEVLTKN